MNDDDRPEDSLTSRERAALSGLRRDLPPPPGLESRVMRQLADRGLLRRPRRPVAAIATGALAAAAMFLFGIWLGASQPRNSATPVGPGSRFLLLLYEDGAYQPAREPTARAREYGAWAHSLARDGRFVVGDELAEGGILVGNTPTPGDSRPSLGGDRPKGYFVIVAPDEAAAVRIAATCPHLGYRRADRRPADPVTPAERSSGLPAKPPALGQGHQGQGNDEPHGVNGCPLDVGPLSPRRVLPRRARRPR